MALDKAFENTAVVMAAVLEVVATLQKGSEALPVNFELFLRNLVAVKREFSGAEKAKCEEYVWYKKLCERYSEFISGEVNRLMQTVGVKILKQLIDVADNKAVLLEPYMKGTPEGVAGESSWTTGFTEEGGNIWDHANNTLMKAPGGQLNSLLSETRKALQLRLLK